MTFNPEFVTILADGSPFRHFEKIQVRAAMKEAARTFSIDTIEGADISKFTFPPGTEIEIAANGQPVCVGYVNVYHPKIGPNSHTVSIQGRSKSQDFVDSAADHPRSMWRNRDPAAIANELDRFNTGITADVPLEPIPYFQLFQGETGFQAIERALRDQGATMLGTADGRIRITNATVAKRMGGALVEGVNMLEADATLNDEGRFGETIVKGQGRTGNTRAELRIRETFRDSGVRRPGRRRMIVQETDSNPARARRRAKHDGQRAAGEGTKCNWSVQGWRDDTGMIWEPGYLVMVQSPSLKLMGDMLIESAVWTQDAGGSKTQLGLVDPAAYQGQRGRVNETDSVWHGPDDIAETGGDDVGSFF